MIITPQKREYNKIYYQKNKASFSAYKKNNRELYRIANQKYRLKYKEKIKAHSIINRAIRAGTVKRKPCVKCGVLKNVQAHHPDYSKPLKVIWLCPIHHSEEHAIKKSFFK